MQAQNVSTKLITSYVTHVSVQVYMIDALLLPYLIWHAATIIMRSCLAARVSLNSVIIFGLV